MLQQRSGYRRDRSEVRKKCKPRMRSGLDYCYGQRTRVPSLITYR